ncbi:lipoprotein [Myxococcus stipitatus DSM 14675]|uniref:Lipoprotein n=1 Tax=Myxococcus stipitatus (strain DSM 14675 / JCM 12634 / Mx s8) TaxID=1278073 RepID=L7U4W9_MYXSD|nr:hypothetical protein [Myxococcus stipitatus]AGC41549.1 lipoprotein [Myxococcus stipitatus DSM 14675]
MKKFLLSALGASVLALSACSGADDSTPVPGGETPVPGGETPVPGGETPVPGGENPIPGGENPNPVPGGENPGTPSAQTFELRIKGEGIGDYTSLKVPISGVSILADGKPLAANVLTDMVELVATPAHSPLAARFTVPAGVDKVKVTVHFNAMGNFAKNGARATELDARVAPVTFEARVSDLRIRGRAVVVLDMARSMVPMKASSTMLMLPNGAVKF